MGFTTSGEYGHRIIVPSYDKDGKLNYFTGRTWLSRKKPKYKNPDLPREEVIFSEQLINTFDHNDLDVKATESA